MEALSIEGTAKTPSVKFDGQEGVTDADRRFTTSPLGRQVLALLSDVIDLARLEARRLPLQSAPPADRRSRGRGSRAMPSRLRCQPGRAASAASASAAIPQLPPSGIIAEDRF